MKTAVIIAEYNPFHNGHAHQISVLREMGFTHIAAVMSGNFVQRGEPAVAAKSARCEAALLGGADLILELPVPFALAGAERFAHGGVAAANALGCADALCFGSECADLELLTRAAEAVEHPETALRISELLSGGQSYPAARQRAVAERYGAEVSTVLSEPNDILAVEYLKQLRRTGSSFVPIAVPRAGAAHDSGEIYGEFASASELRRMARSGSAENLCGFVPDPALEILQREQDAGRFPCGIAKLETAILAKLRCCDIGELAALPDVSEGLEHRIFRAVKEACSLDELYALIKTRRYTHARIRRIVLAAFLGLSRELASAELPYLQVLGFSARGTELLAKIKRSAKLPVSHSLAWLERGSVAMQDFARIEARAGDLFALCMPEPGRCGEDYTQPVIRV